MSILDVHGKKTTFGHFAHYTDRFNTAYPALIVQLGSGVDAPTANLLVYHKNGDTKPELDVPYSATGEPNTWNHLPTEPEAALSKEEQRKAEKAAEEEREASAPVAPEEPPAKKSSQPR